MTKDRLPLDRLPNSPLPFPANDSAKRFPKQNAAPTSRFFRTLSGNLSGIDIQQRLPAAAKLPTSVVKNYLEGKKVSDHRDPNPPSDCFGR
jgi:hypothetical protein